MSSAFGANRVLNKPKRYKHVAPRLKNLHLVNDRRQRTGAVTDDVRAIPVEGEGRGVLKTDGEQRADGVGVENKWERGASELQVLVMNDVVVVALVRTLEARSRYFMAHVVQVGEHAVQRAEGCAAAADYGALQALQHIVAVALADPL